MDVCRRLRAAQPQLLIIMLTARSERDAIIAGLDAGADDYLAKPFDCQELVARVRALLRRDMRVRQPVLRCGDLTLDPAAGRLRQGDRDVRLTRKQFRILEYLMRRRGEIVSQESTVPIVMLTKRNTESDRQQGLAAGANAYMTKPFEADELLATVRSLLPGTASA
jgi:DNA-binding response OmpR family regulator